MEDFKRLRVIFNEEISFFGSQFSQKNNYRDVKLSFHVTFRLWSGFNRFMSEDISKNNTKEIKKF
jgi:pyoverdine/dityrosine biosynthesis protein Dit1